MDTSGDEGTMRRPSIGAGVVAGKAVEGARRMSKNLVDTARRLSGVGAVSSSDDERADDDDYDNYDEDERLANQSTRMATRGTVVLGLLLGALLLAGLSLTRTTDPQAERGGKMGHLPRRNLPLLAVHHSKRSGGDGDAAGDAAGEQLLGDGNEGSSFVDEGFKAAPADEELMQHRKIVGYQYAELASGQPVSLSCKSSANMHLLGALRAGQSLLVRCPASCDFVSIDSVTGGRCTRTSKSCSTVLAKPSYFKQHLWGSNAHTTMGHLEQGGYFEESLVCLAAAHAFGDLLTTNAAGEKVIEGLTLKVTIVRSNAFRGDERSALALKRLATNDFFRPGAPDGYVSLKPRVSADRLKPGHGFVLADEHDDYDFDDRWVQKELLEQTEALWGEFTQTNIPMAMSSEFLKEMHAFYEPRPVFRDQEGAEL
jgi:hypothetical protein